MVNPDVVAFWNTLPSAQLIGAYGNYENPDESGDMCLKLPDDTYFIGDQKFGSMMFVRDCYQELAEVTFEIMESGNNLVITGIAGIGKSFFLFYFLYRLRLREAAPTVVLYRHLEKRWYLFSNNGVLTAELEQIETILSIKKYLDNRNTWYLVDTDTPLERKAKTLLMTSPYVDRFKEFRKTNCDIRFMPVWNKEELSKCRLVRVFIWCVNL